ncbi:MAG: radical SAM protein [Firmicutes bacterium HGW-Firmicutes-15]|nr:MAG: radical SAM protein [Firmicutes bacterium HGW-Firmicutes-15]
MFLTLYANDKGEIIERHKLGMLGRSGMDWVVPEQGEMIPLPNGASLVSVPGHIPVGIDENDCLSNVTSANGARKAQAVAALLPQGFTRTFLPACVSPEQDARLPLMGYAAVGFKDEKIWVAAVQSDEHRKWHPCYYNTEGLPRKINRMLKKFPENRILKQLANCSLQYSCYTAQNIFYGRWEAGIPTMTACNAGCIGCISESHIAVDSPQQRLDFHPSVEEISELGIEHLSRAREGIISFGQGCEGEPSLNADTLAQAVVKIRQHSKEGTININTNAGYTTGIKKLCHAGLDAMRVTIFSCREDNYNRYHCPKNYRLDDVECSIQHAKEQSLYVSLNLLTFPGFTDREEEVEMLLEFVRKNGVDMIQLRNLNIDPALLFHHIPVGGEVLGINQLIHILQEEMPVLKIASYSHPAR